MRAARKEQLLRDLLVTAMRFGTAVTIHEARPHDARHLADHYTGIVDVLERNGRLQMVALDGRGGRTFDILYIERVEFFTVSGPGSDKFGQHAGQATRTAFEVSDELLQWMIER